jgi:hypothetical protein
VRLEDASHDGACFLDAFGGQSIFSSLPEAFFKKEKNYQ